MVRGTNKRIIEINDTRGPPGIFVQPQIPVAGSFSAAFRSGRRYPDLFAAALTRFTDSGKTFSPNFFLLQCKSFQNML